MPSIDGPSAGSVRAKTMIHCASVAADVHIFWPLIVHPLPSRSARVRNVRPRSVAPVALRHPERDQRVAGDEIGQHRTLLVGRRVAAQELDRGVLEDRGTRPSTSGRDRAPRPRRADRAGRPRHRAPRARRARARRCPRARGRDHDRTRARRPLLRVRSGGDCRATSARSIARNSARSGGSANGSAARPASSSRFASNSYSRPSRSLIAATITRVDPRRLRHRGQARSAPVVSLGRPRGSSSSAANSWCRN